MLDKIGKDSGVSPNEVFAYYRRLLVPLARFW